MGIVYMCIAPHGTEIIPKLAGDKLEAFNETRRGMESLAQQMKKHSPSTLVLATPHGLRLNHTLGIVTAEFSEGSLSANRKSVKMRFRCDRQLAQEILRRAKKAKLPVIGVNYGTSEGPSSCMPMDWGTIIPLWFLGRSERGKKKKEIVIVTPSREIPLTQLVGFGKIIAEASEASGKKVAFIASADQGHAHDRKGPYGFHSASEKYDKQVIMAIKEGTLRQLLKFDRSFVEDSKPDSLWQIAILIGILERVRMKRRFVSYQAPTYYGLLCADFEHITRED